jgi:hypothetical protein
VAYDLGECPFVFGPAGGFGIESIHASGFGGTLHDFDVSAGAGTFGAGGFTSWSLSSLIALRFDVEGEAPFGQPSFHVDELSPPNSLVFRLPAITARTLLAAQVMF